MGPTGKQTVLLKSILPVISAAASTNTGLYTGTNCCRGNHVGFGYVSQYVTSMPKQDTGDIHTHRLQHGQPVHIQYYCIPYVLPDTYFFLTISIVSHLGDAFIERAFQ